MTKLKLKFVIASEFLLAISPAFGQNNQGRAVVTILPAHGGDLVPAVSPQDVKIKIDGKEGSVIGFAPMDQRNSRLELIVLIDGGVRASLGAQFDEISKFVKEMPANSKITLGYMINGQAKLAGPLSSDAEQVAKELHLSAGAPGTSASPYFCLTDLAQNWPSNDREARRVVVMITDGVDNYSRRLDPSDPYVQKAIKESVRAGIEVYSMYWQTRGRINSTEYETSTGQSLLQVVADSTGGYTYGQGNGNPVSFDPYFTDLRRRLAHQYVLTFSAPARNKPDIASLKLDLKVASAKVVAPRLVFVGPAAPTRGE